MFKNTKTDTSGSNAVASQKGCAKFTPAIHHNAIQTVQIAKFTLLLIFLTRFFLQHWIESGEGKMAHSGIQLKNALHRRRECNYRRLNIVSSYSSLIFTASTLVLFWNI
jgi:hypothetical protein